jgi:hypothetical protein
MMSRVRPDQFEPRNLVPHWRSGCWLPGASTRRQVWVRNGPRSHVRQTSVNPPIAAGNAALSCSSALCQERSLAAAIAPPAHNPPWCGSNCYTRRIPHKVYDVPETVGYRSSHRREKSRRYVRGLYIAKALPCLTFRDESSAKSRIRAVGGRLWRDGVGWWCLSDEGRC